MSKIFPKEIIENTAQSYIPKNKTKSKIIYAVLLVLIVTILIALPFLQVKIYTTSRGIIKPDLDRVGITSINSGKVVFSNLKNNQYVEKGDILLIIKNDVLDDQIALTEYEVQQFSEQIKDLNYLINSGSHNLRNIRSAKYQKEYIQYSERKNEFSTRLKKLKIDYDRNELLLSRGVIARAEFENIKLEYDLGLNSLYQYKKQQLSSWQATLTELETHLKTTENKNSQFKKNKKEYIITAPLSGTLIIASGIEKGSVINAGSRLGEISPDSDLLAECYIKPLDIGLIDKTKPVNFQIDAFNYNQWGLATGSIIDITEDVQVIDDQPVFKARCKMNEQYLQLKNGAKGKIGKGMTFSVRFELTERTLYELLYDKIDDWMNPGRQDNIVGVE